MKKQPSRIRPRAGFTLVELIVVLVILSLLLSMVVPSMTQWLSSANRQKAEVECRACVVAAQTLAVEKYTAGTVTAWIADDTTRNDDIKELAGVPGHVANDSTESPSVDYPRGVAFDRVYTVTYLKYYYSGERFVIYLNGEFYYDDDLPDLPERTPGPSATASPTPRPTIKPTATATATPAGGVGVPVYDTTVLTNKSYTDAWHIYEWHGNHYAKITEGDIFQDSSGKFYYVLKTTDNIYLPQYPNPDSIRYWGEILEFTGTIYNNNSFEPWGYIISQKGDMYTDGTHHWVQSRGGGWTDLSDIKNSRNGWIQLN